MHVPVSNAVTSMVVVTLMLMGDMKVEVGTVKGTFLKEDIEDREEIHLELPQGSMVSNKQLWYLWRKLLECMKYIDIC